jgi:hypothetical protein
VVRGPALDEMWVALGAGPFVAGEGRTRAPEPDGGVRQRARGGRGEAGRRHPKAHNTATGATGVPVPPMNGSGIAESKKL